MPMTRKAAQWWLAGVWTAAFLALFILLAVETLILSLYEGREGEAWGWFTPLMVPTVALIVGTLVGQTRNGSGDARVSPGVFWLAFSLSLAYLGLVGFTVVVAAVKSSLGPLKTSSWYLGVIQGLVTSALGAFFVREGATKTRDNSATDLTIGTGAPPRQLHIPPGPPNS